MALTSNDDDDQGSDAESDDVDLQVGFGGLGINPMEHDVSDITFMTVADPEAFREHVRRMAEHYGVGATASMPALAQAPGGTKAAAAAVVATVKAVYSMRPRLPR